MKHTKRFTALTALLLCAVLLFSFASAAFAEKDIDWDKWVKKAEDILEAEGHDLSPVVRIEYEFHPKKETKVAHDQYWIMFYYDPDTIYCKYRVCLTTKGVLTVMETDNPPDRDHEDINKPKEGDIDLNLYETGKDTVRAFLKKYNKSLLSIVDDMIVKQISIKDDITWYTLLNRKYSVIFRVRVTPFTRIEYFMDYR